MESIPQKPLSYKVTAYRPGLVKCMAGFIEVLDVPFTNAQLGKEGVQLLANKEMPHE